MGLYIQIYIYIQLSTQICSRRVCHDFNWHKSPKNTTKWNQITKMSHAIYCKMSNKKKPRAEKKYISLCRMTFTFYLGFACPHTQTHTHTYFIYYCYCCCCCCLCWLRATTASRDSKRVSQTWQLFVSKKAKVMTFFYASFFFWQPTKVWLLV